MVERIEATGLPNYGAKSSPVLEITRTKGMDYVDVTADEGGWGDIAQFRLGLDEAERLAADLLAMCITRKAERLRGE